MDGEEKGNKSKCSVNFLQHKANISFFFPLASKTLRQALRIAIIKNKNKQKTKTKEPILVSFLFPSGLSTPVLLILMKCGHGRPLTNSLFPLSPNKPEPQTPQCPCPEVRYPVLPTPFFPFPLDPFLRHTFLNLESRFSTKMIDFYSLQSLS